MMLHQKNGRFAIYILCALVQSPAASSKQAAQKTTRYHVSPRISCPNMRALSVRVR